MRRNGERFDEATAQARPAMITQAVQVRPYEQADADSWESYVQSQLSATVFHRLAWSRAVAPQEKREEWAHW